MTSGVLGTDSRGTAVGLRKKTENVALTAVVSGGDRVSSAFVEFLPLRQLVFQVAKVLYHPYLLTPSMPGCFSAQDGKSQKSHVSDSSSRCSVPGPPNAPKGLSKLSSFLEVSGG